MSQVKAKIEAMQAEKRSSSGISGMTDDLRKSLSVGVRLSRDQYRRCLVVQERYSLRSVGGVLLYFLTQGLGKEAEYEVNRESLATVKAMVTQMDDQIARENAPKKGRKS